MEILKGLPVANSINEQLIEDIKNIDGELPHLAIIRVGERPDDCSYERGAVKKMDKVGVRCTTYTFAADISNDEFQKEFDQINNNPDIAGETSSPAVIAGCPQAESVRARQNRRSSVFFILSPR